MTDDGPAAAASGSDSTVAVARTGRVGRLTLNRPQALNALRSSLATELIAAARELDVDPGIGAILLTGAGRSYAAGADVRELAPLDLHRFRAADWFRWWDDFADLRTPVVAAVAGHALGGGFELAMMCNVVVAADTAVFGHPEILLGTIPGMGGTQRLTRAVGKAKVMDLILTGRPMTADEAERAGPVSRVVPAESLMEEATWIATTVAHMSLPVAVAAKEVVNRAFESSRSEGLLFERRSFHATFALEDRARAMSAFANKESASFIHHSTPPITSPA